MPIITIECRAGLAVDLKARIAGEITEKVREVIKSPLDLISVVFHDLASESTYRSGCTDFGHAHLLPHQRRRSDGAVLTLAKDMSAIWSRCTGASEDHIEVAVATYPAKYVVRGGERLPEAPRV